MEILKPQDILNQTTHRGFPLPNSDWAAYSEWKNVLMLHWKVDASLVKHLLPPQLSVDTFEGGAWVTICVASIDNFRNKLLNIIKQGFSFDQITMQTYVLHQGKPGLFVFNQELEKSFTKNIYQRIFKLKQGETIFQREYQNGLHKFFAKNDFTGFKLGLHYTSQQEIAPCALTDWLSNRFKYFYEKDDELFEYNVHHTTWQFSQVDIEKFKVYFNFGGLFLSQQPDLAYHSKGIQKLFWPKNLINKTK